MAFDKLAWLLLKIFVALLVFSVVTSVTNIVPYYLKMVGTANDLLLRASVNNYILEENVKEIIKSEFEDNDMGRFLTYNKSPENTKSVNGSGVFVYTKVTADPSFNPFPKNVGCNLGEYCSSYTSPSGTRQVTLKENPSSWDPKTKDADTLRFRRPPQEGGYGGAQRGETISIRVETKMRAKAVFAGFNIDFEIPLAVERSSPAMHYYRI